MLGMKHAACMRLVCIAYLLFTDILSRFAFDLDLLAEIETRVIRGQDALLLQPGATTQNLSATTFSQPPTSIYCTI